MARRLKTLGPPSKRTEFLYSGSIHDGVVLHQSGNPSIKAAVFREALTRFAGTTMYGGFQEDAPLPGGFGEWLENESRRLNSRKLTPRHGSFVAAILCAEAGVESSLDGNAVVLRFPTSKEDESFAFVMNVADITGAEKYELAPGHVLRRATSNEITEINERIKPVGNWIPLVTPLWEFRRTKDGQVEELPAREWRYFVIGFNGGNDELTRLEAALDIAPLELEIGFIFIRMKEFGVTGIIHDSRRLFQVLEHAPYDESFFKSLSTRDLATIAEIHRVLEAHDPTLIDARRLAREVGQLKALPYASPLQFLGYFSILESLLTHPPKVGDPYDSITRQVKKKITLLDNRWSPQIDYTPFGSANSENVWKTMYGYRSKIAHGGNPRIEGEFQLLGSHENALQLVKETVKSTIRYALDEPQLLVDLRNC